MGYDSKINASAGLTVDYFARADRTGWHAGVFMFLWRYEVSRNGDTSRFVNHVIMPRVGYRWFPFHRTNFYVDPFLGLMTEYTVRGDSRVDGEVYRPTPLIPFATVHVGYHF